MTGASKEDIEREFYRATNELKKDQQGNLVITKLNEAGEIQYEQARNDLALRVAQAYFDVLAAQDVISFIRAQKAAITEQLESAKRNFEVGTATITDTHEAQARFDLAIAQEIAAQNDLEVKRNAFAVVTGQLPPELKSLRAGVKLSDPHQSCREQEADDSRAKQTPLTSRNA